MKYLVIFLLLIGQQCYSQVKIFNSFSDVTRFFMQNMQYAQEAIDSNVTGTVLVTANVKDGEVYAYTISYTQSQLLVKEIDRVMQKGRKLWKFIKNETVVVIPFEYYETGIGFPYRPFPEWDVPKPAMSIIPQKGTSILIMKPIEVFSVLVCVYPTLPKPDSTKH